MLKCVKFSWPIAYSFLFENMTGNESGFGDRRRHCFTLSADSDGACFVCLQSANNGSSKLKGSSSLSTVFRYLGINIVKQTFSDGRSRTELVPSSETEVRASLGRSDFNVQLCRECSAVTKKASRLIPMLEVLQMEINHCLDTIESWIFLSTSTPGENVTAREQYHYAATGGKQLIVLLESVQTLRQRLSKKCKSVVSKAQPLVKLERNLSLMKEVSERRSSSVRNSPFPPEVSKVDPMEVEANDLEGSISSPPPCSPCPSLEVGLDFDSLRSPECPEVSSPSLLLQRLLGTDSENERAQTQLRDEADAPVAVKTEEEDIRPSESEDKSVPSGGISKRGRRRRKIRKWEGAVLDDDHELSEDNDSTDANSSQNKNGTEGEILGERGGKKTEEVGSGSIKESETSGENSGQHENLNVGDDKDEIEERIKCKQCPKTFTSVANLLVHEKHIHLQGRRCPKCDKLYSRRCHTYEEHVRKCQRKGPPVSRHKPGPRICKFCGVTLSGELELRSHRRMFHVPRKAKFTCEYCGKNLFDKSGLKKHMKMHFGIRYHCTFPNCGLSYARRASLIGHQYKRHPGVEFENKESDDELPPADLLPPPMPLEKSSTFSNPEKFMCDLCAKTFTDKKHFLYHQKSHSGKQCPKCHRMFSGSSYLYKTHIATCTGIRRRPKKAPSHLCTACGKLFITASALVQHHEIVHLKLKRYMCEICGDAGFYFKKQLEDHQTSKHSTVRFPCDVPGCTKLSATQTEMTLHRRIVHADLYIAEKLERQRRIRERMK